MKAELKTLTLLTLTAVVLGCGSYEKTTQTINRRWDSAGVQRLALKTVNGEVTISAGDSRVITMEAEAHVRGSRRDLKPEDLIRTEISNGTLTIADQSRGGSFRVPFFNFGRSEQEIDYRIEIPSTMELTVNNVNGEIIVEGIEAASVIHSVNGAIEFATNAAPLEAKTVNGSIDAAFRKSFPGAKIRTVNGPVVVTVPAGTKVSCSISQVNGGFESNIPVEVNSGGSSNGATFGRLQVSTVNGDIRVRKLEIPAVPPVPAVAPVAPSHVVPEVPKVPALPEGPAIPQVPHST